MDKISYKVLDHIILDAIQVRDKVIKRNKKN